MGHSVLIDTESMAIVGSSKQKDSAKCLAILADINKVPDSYVIVGPEEKWFASFSTEELLKMYTSMTGDEIKRVHRPTVLNRCMMFAERFEVDERTSGQLIAALGRPFTTSKLPAPEKGGSRSKKEGGYTRPKEGTATGRVWDICDEQMKLNDQIPDKQLILDLCTAEGMNPSTAGTQFGKWKSTQ